MTGGFAALPIAEDGGDHDNGTHLAGESRILGPKWLQLPALSIGLLGVQMLWSVEMSYGMHPHGFLCRNTTRRSYLLQEHRTYYLWDFQSLPCLWSSWLVLYLV